MPTDKPKARRPVRAAAAAAAMPAHSHAAHHAPLHTHAEHHSPAKKEQDMLALVAVLVTVFGLGLASYDLTLAVNLRNASEELFSTAVFEDDILNRRPINRIDETPAATAVPPVLWAVANPREGERDLLERNLVGPMLADSLANGPKYRAVMVERRTAGATNVNVRLFHEDGTEQSYLWPNTHATKEGVWMSDVPQPTPAPAANAAGGTVPAGSGVVPAPNE